MANRDATQSALTVYGVGTPRTLRVHWALHELGCLYTTVPVMPRSAEAGSAAYRAMNPAGKVPTLIDGAFTLSESGAIVNYLLRRYGAVTGLQPPNDPKALGRYDEWTSIALMELDATTEYVLRRHVDLHAVFGTAPAAIDAARRYWTQALLAAAQRFGDGPHALGEAFSGVDIVLVTCVDCALHRQVDVPAALQAHHARMTSRAAYRTALSANHPV